MAVDADGLVPPHAFELPRLEEMQQLGLEVGAQLAHGRGGGLLVEQVHLGHGHGEGQVDQTPPVLSQFAAQDVEGRTGRLQAGVDHQQEGPGALDVPQELVPEALALARALDEARDVRHRAAHVVPEVEDPEVPEWNVGFATNPDENVLMAHAWGEIRRLMWNYVGIVRTNKRLTRARRRIVLLKEEINEYYWDFRVTPDLIELRNLVTIAELVIECASRRKESRGLHYTLNHPERDDENFLSDTVVRRL